MMKEKRLYQSPTTRRDVVELEDGFCGSIMESPSSAVQASHHETGFDNTKETNADGFTSTEWQ